MFRLNHFFDLVYTMRVKNHVDRIRPTYLLSYNSNRTYYQWQLCCNCIPFRNWTVDVHRCLV